MTQVKFQFQKQEVVQEFENFINHLVGNADLIAEALGVSESQVETLARQVEALILE